MKWSLSVAGTLSLSATLLFLAGCGFDSASAPPSLSSLGPIQGNVHGGQQPVIGASVYLFQTGIGGSGGSGIAAATANQSKSLLTSSTPGAASDGANYYVTTGSGGIFTISSGYTCTVGYPVYLYVVGGTPISGGSINSAAGFLAGLGLCPAGGDLDTIAPSVFVDEVSTVVTAYALAGYATDATHISTSGSTLAGTDIANAMDTVGNLVNVAGGLYATTHATGSAGTIPQQLIYSIADILAACVNSTGSTSTACSTLFNDARSGGGQTGSEATNTATAAIYLAQHPYSTYVSTLFNLASSKSPFPSTLSSAPANYILAITYTGNGITRTADDQGYPGTVAIDGAGNVWIVNYSKNTVSAFSNMGAPLTNSPFSGNGLSLPLGVAIDTNERIWVANYSTNGANKESLSVFNDTGTAYADVIDNGTGCLDDPGNIAFDSSGNVWLSVVGGYSLCKMNSTATTFAIIGGSSLLNPLGLAGDTSGNMWVANANQNDATGQINKFNSAGTNVNGSPFTGSQIADTYSVAVDASNNAWVSSQNNMLKISSTGSIGSAITGGGITEPDGVAIDGAGNIWEADYGTYGTDAPNGNGAVIELNSSGAPLSGTAGFMASSTFTGQGLAIDGSGNAWVDNLSTNQIRELVGAAAPVVTPLALAVKNGTLAARP